jgi:hypothetical protein
LYWYENPQSGCHSKWKRHNVARLEMPVAMEHADIDGDGFIDLIISYDYGKCITDCDPSIYLEVVTYYGQSKGRLHG